MSTLFENQKYLWPWTTLNNLSDPFNDAVNYKTRQQKEFFNRIFLKTESLEECLGPSVYFLIGEKGSGKTAYAAFLDNNEVKEHRCKLSTMTESQYKRFIALKAKGKLDYSDYANIWRPMLLNMVAQALAQKSKGFLSSFTGKFDAIEAEIEAFNSGALNPEVEVAFEMVSETTDKGSAGKEGIASISLEDKQRESTKTEKIRHHLLEQERRLKIALSDLRLGRNHVLFIDGIDYRPESVAYKDYLACVKGLGEAAWDLNTTFFGNIRDSKGRIKIALLVRPDVFNALNLYNSNSRLRDNAVFLEWTTTEEEMRRSNLYKAAGQFFARQQTFEVDPVEAADHYLSSAESDQIFRRLLRSSFQKPRDVLTFMKIARELLVKQQGKGVETRFPSEIVKDGAFTRLFADYLLGEVRNYASFYMEQNDFNLFLKLFQYLHGKREFTYPEYERAFNSFKTWIDGEKVAATEYLRDPEALLQFFFDVNVIGYRELLGQEQERFIHFAYRERTLMNVAPKVKTTGVLLVNPGIAKSLDLGMKAHAVTPDSVPAKRRAQRRRFHDRRPKSNGQALSATSSKRSQPSRQQDAARKQPTQKSSKKHSHKPRGPKTGA
ncbi:P-loop ATPase, Sll1717 family [Aquariibacter albus]|uniref:FunZ protein n=1 Tax=Aquariibacter albus TaxID=2759899 RepID=A0A839HTE4_9BURK|nr:hypothetical protein [Aquariibacter albus]MBB1161194.1 hypothetical protein [Aquariibacter albus]